MPLQQPCVGGKPGVFLVCMGSLRKLSWMLVEGCHPGGPRSTQSSPASPTGEISAQRTLSRCGPRNPPGPQVRPTRLDQKAPFPGLHGGLNSSHPNSEKRTGRHMLPLGRADPDWSPQAS